jgi:molybdate transport system permease protein
MGCALLAGALAPTLIHPAGLAADPTVSSAQRDSVLLVLAAASLADVLPIVGTAWERAGGVPVTFSFDATSRLAVQATQSGSADVFFAADREWMRWLVERDAVSASSATLIGMNELVVVVPVGRAVPASPEALVDLQRIALAGENVPAGRYARTALELAGVWASVERRIVRSGSVRGALEWVARGEVPAGVVYRTDADAEPGVRIAFSFTAPGQPRTEYWAAELRTTDDGPAAADFVAFVAGDVGQALLREAGFGVPAAGSQSRTTQVGQSETGSGSSPGTPSVGSAIRLSVLVALLATIVGLVPAIALGWLLARCDFRGKTLLSTLVMAPLVVPPVVTGFLLLSVLGGSTPLGRLLARMGLEVPFTIVGAAIAAFVVGLPLYVISIRGAFEAVDRTYEELSWTLGSPPHRTFIRVSLPLALPGIAAGAILAFARALGEFGATVVLAGNVEGSTRTIALAVYTLLESPSGRDTIWVLVGASVVISLLALLGFETLSRRQKQRIEGRHAR